MKVHRRSVVAALTATMVVQLFVTTAVLAADIGFRDFAYNDSNGVQTPTEDKPQSKLWFQDGRWWGMLYSPVAHSTDIYSLDDTHRTWTDTGTVVDNRPTARGDALWDGQKLYVVTGTTVVSEFGVPPNPSDVAAGSAKLLRFSYNATSKTYSLDSGFPVILYQGSTESVTIAKDSTGMLWATFTKVAADNSNKVYVLHSTGSDTAWVSPFAIPSANANIHYDDISAIVTVGGNSVGIMWSNQLGKKFYFATHQDGAPDSSWQVELAYGGGVGGCSTGCANDHMNLKQLSSDGSGRVFAAIKTANRNTGQPFVVLIVRNRHASWSGYQFGAVEDLHTRPMVMIDEEHREIFMFAVSPEVGGSVYYKKSSLDNISFPPGVGTPLMQSSQDTDISDPTSTKQNVNSASGIVVLASANTNARYWHGYLNLAGEPAPTPAAPTNTTITRPATNADTSLQLSWSDNSVNETGFAIERKTGTGAYGEITRTASNITTYLDTALAPATTYTYRVRAFNSVGYSTYDDPAMATTAQTGPVRTFFPIADTYVDSGVPSAIYGLSQTLSVDASPVQEAYLKFQVEGLTGTTVTSAKVRMYVSDNASVKGGSLSRMTNTTWSETGVNYTNRPAIDGPFQSSLAAVNLQTWYEFPLLNGTISGDGTVSFGINSTSSDGVHYASREDTSHAPQLVVTVTPGDSIPPETTIDSGPSGLVTSTSATFAFSSNETGSTFDCSLDGAAFAACSSPLAYTALAEGAHTFSVRATDAAGNPDPTPATRSWTIDSIAPSTILAPTPALTNSSTQTFSFSADEAGVSFACSLDGSTFAACSSPQVYSGLIDGSHTFTVRATDPAGNVEQAPPSATWTVDTVPPDTLITGGPTGTSTTSSATFTFTSSEANSTFECTLDGSAYAACTSPQTYSGLVDGSHTFTVRATDAAGNVDATPKVRTWIIDTTVVDTTPPTVTVTAPAAGQLVRGPVTITADATDNAGVDHVDFLVNGAVVGSDATAPYITSWASSSVPDGTASLTARAVDTSANVGLSAPVSVTVDNTPPDTTITSAPAALVTITSASFAFSSDDPTATFECRLDSAPYVACSSPQAYTGLTDGSHTFLVRAKDPAGNVDLSPASSTWTVDTVPPDTAITSGPSGTVNTRSATFSFSSTEPGSFECSLDAAPFAGCASPRQYAGLVDGAHTFRVRGIDAAGLVDQTPASGSWTVDPISFTDGFETGDFSKWSSVHKAIDGTAVVQTSVKKSGTYAAKLTAPSSTSYVYLRETLAASQTDLTVSGDFDITVEGIEGQEVPIFKLYDASSVRVVYVYRRNVSGRIYVVYGGTTYPSTQKLSLSTWAAFSVHTVTAGPGTSSVEVKMDGISIYSSSTASLGTAGIRTIQVGNDKQLPFSLYVDNVVAQI